MRNFLLAGLLVLTSGLALAEPFALSKSVVCDDLKTIVTNLSQRYKERITWMGSEPESKSIFILMSNDKESTWTLLQTNGETACILGTGTDPMFLLGEKI